MALIAAPAAVATRDRGEPPNHRSVPLGHVAATTALAVLAGVTAVWLARLPAESLLTAVTVVALVVPLVLATGRLWRSTRAVVPFLLAVAIVYFFVPRLINFDPASGLVAILPLSPEEIDRNKPIAELALIAFATSIALIYLLVPLDQASRRALTIARSDAELRSTLRFRTALVFGVLGSMAAIVTGLALGVGARTYQASSASSPLALFEFFSVGVPAALWLARHRRLSIVLLCLSMIGPYLEGGRQSVLTPLIVLLIAVAAPRGRPEPPRRRLSTRAVVIGAVVLLGAVGATVATTSKRSLVETAVNGGASPSITTSLVVDQTLFDSLLIAVAREPRPQGLDIYSRVLAAPIPRTVWPNKPLSYDYDFRQRHFPQFEDAIPISIVGTSFVSFLLPGAILAGALLAGLALGAERLLARRGQRSILMAAMVGILALDLLRIGGFYRELLTFAGSALGLLVITRAARPAAERLDELEGRTTADAVRS